MIFHPIVEQLKPSDEQRPAIASRGRDVVVTAGAGAGKTRTLVARYLALVAEGVPLRAIIAITFTKKAAREMRNRARAEMRDYLARPELAPDERAFWDAQYNALDAARIDTIHGLCAEILRAHPAEAEIDPRFDVLSEGAHGVLRGDAVDAALAWAADDPHAAILFTTFGEKLVRAALEHLLARRLAAQAAFAAMPEDVHAFWQTELRAMQRAALDDLRANDAWRDAVATLREHHAQDGADKIEQQRVAARAALDAARGELDQQLAALARLNQLDLRYGAAKSWRGGKAELDQVRAALVTVRAEWRARDALALQWNELDDQLARALPALRAAFDHARAHYAARKRQDNLLDFDDLEQLALDLLRRDVNTRARWQMETRALLVDEFQDTNQRQRDLIDLLNGAGGKLFIVGDAKQSIYRFRGADVTVFRGERARIENTGDAFTLAISYRAHRALLDGLNDLVHPALGAADATRPWIEPFAALKHFRAQPRIAAQHIEFHLTVGSKSDGALDRTADALAARIGELVNADACAFGDVAVLCRASTSFGAYEDAFERAHIPFLTVAGRGFYQRPEIRDTLNILRALADPTDDLALFGLLRSPAFAWRDDELDALAQDRAANETWWDVLQLRGANFSPNATRAVALIRDLRARIGRATVADTLKEFFDATDYRAALLARGQTRAAGNLSKLLADAHASGLVGVGEFLEYIKNLRDAGSREGEARATAEGAAQILTVHAAKGLEFPVVVIGDIAYQAKERADTLIDARLGVVVPHKKDETRPAVYASARARERELEDAESARLFYVAATRAKEKLIVNGCLTLDAKNRIANPRGWLALIAGADALNIEGTPLDYDGEGARVHSLDWQIGATPIACSVYEPRIEFRATITQSQSQVARDAVAAFPLLAPLPVRAEIADEKLKRDPPPRVWRVAPSIAHARAPRWVIGALVHEALAQWRFPDARFESWVDARVREYGIADDAQRRDAARATRGLLERFQRHELCAEMESAERRLHEVEYALDADEHIATGKIDALYLRAGAWTIVEFKTDHLRDQDALAKKLAQEDYLVQARRYADAVVQMIHQSPRVALCFLDVARAVAVRGWEPTE